MRCAYPPYDTALPSIRYVVSTYVKKFKVTAHPQPQRRKGRRERKEKTAYAFANFAFLASLRLSLRDVLPETLDARRSQCI
jgi:hypothetical protein